MASAARFLILCLLISLVLAAPLPAPAHDKNRSSSVVRPIRNQYAGHVRDWASSSTVAAEDEPTESASEPWAATTTTTTHHQPTATASYNEDKSKDNYQDDDITTHQPTATASYNDDVDEDEDKQDDTTTTTTTTITTTTTTSHKPTATASYNDDGDEDDDAANSTSSNSVATASRKKGGSGGGSYSGSATWYNVGLGSCGSTDSDSQLVAAMNHAQMANGGNSNNNSNCGRRAHIKGPNGSVTVKIVDTCPSCGFGDIDLSPAAFKKIADLDTGVVSISWSW